MWMPAGLLLKYEGMYHSGYSGLIYTLVLDHSDWLPATCYYRETTQPLRALSQLGSACKKYGLRRENVIEKEFVVKFQVLPTEIASKCTTPVPTLFDIIYI